MRSAGRFAGRATELPVLARRIDAARRGTGGWARLLAGRSGALDEAGARRGRPVPRRTVVRARSNRQIADELVLSERTIESHVRSILAKVGCANRTQLATRWQR